MRAPLQNLLSRRARLFLHAVLAPLLLFVAEPVEAANDASYISVYPFCARADGVQSCDAVVKVFDDSGSPLAGRSVTLYSSRSESDVIGPANPQTTDANGEAHFTIRSSVRGSSTIIAVCDGQSINKGVIQAGAVGIWSFENNARDLSGKNNNGTLQGSPGFANGRHGQAISLNGTSQYVSVPHQNSLNNRHAWTIDGWIYLDALPSGRSVILQKSSSSAGDFYMSVSNKAVRTRCATRGGADELNKYAIQTPNNVLSAGKWHHLVGVWSGLDPDPVWDDGTLRIFVDGVEKKYYDISRYLCRNQSQPLNIGRDPAGGSFFKGKIDELKLYNRPLYPPEIQRSLNFSTTVDFFLEPPASLGASVAQPECVRLSWPLCTNTDVTSYRIYRSTAPGVTPSAANQVDEVPYTVGTCSDWYVDYGVRYYYVVTACSITNESAVSSEVSAVPVKAVTAPRWYGGDTHVHSIYSQDVMYHPPTELANQAKAKGFDFLFITDHNSIAGRHEFNTNSTPSFIGLTGEEVSLSTSGDNDHFNAFFIKQYVSVDGTEVQLHDRVRAQGGLAMPNHCGAYAETTNIDGLEIVHGDVHWDTVGAWDAYLKQGFKITGRGSTDAHGNCGDIRMLLWLDRLSAKEMYNALKLGRTCAVTGPGIECMLRVNGAMIGDTLSINAGRTLNIEMTAKSDSAISKMELVKSGTVVWSAAPNATPVTRTYTDVSGGTNTYYRLQVQDADGKWALGGAVYVQYEPPASGPPVIIEDLPPRLTLAAGTHYTYSLLLNGSEPFGYQWCLGGAPLESQTNASYVFTAGAPGGSTCCVVVTNAFGSVTSAVSTITVVPQLADFYAVHVLWAGAAGYWPLLERTAPAPVTMETNLGTLGPPGNAYYAMTGPGDVVLGQAGALASSGDNDPAVEFVGVDGTSANTIVNVNSYAFVPRSSPALTLQPPLTLECWINDNVNNGSFGDLMGEGGNGLDSSDNSGDCGGIRMSYGGSFSGGPNLQVYTYTGDGNTRSNGGTPANSLPRGTWHHCAATYDGTTVLMYIDGVQQGSFSATMAPDTWSPLTIGQGLWYGNHPQRAFSGLEDEVAIYTNVLPAATISNHYQAGITGGVNYKAAVLADHPLLYYRMNAPEYVVAPAVEQSPMAVNYGAVAVPAFYLAGTVPGGVGGPMIPALGTNSVAAAINGVFGCVDAGRSWAFDPTGMQPFTAMTWFRTYPSDNGIGALMSHGADYSWSIHLTGADGRIVFSTGAGGEVISTNMLNDGIWHHVAGVYDGSGNYLYVDGALNNSSPATGGIVGNAGDELYLGGDPDFTEAGGNERHFAGALAQAAFFTNALSAGYVRMIYQSGLVLPPATTLRWQKLGGGELQLEWDYGWLQSATNAGGSYSDLPGAMSPHLVVPTNGSRFYRVREN